MTPGRTASAFAPPIMAAQSWLRGVVFPPDRPLINVSQAAPVGAPPLALREAMGEAVCELFEDSSWHTLDALCVMLLLVAVLALAAQRGARRIS